MSKTRGYGEVDEGGGRIKKKQIEVFSKRQAEERVRELIHRLIEPLSKNDNL
jgi:uncharacterized membrane-anchored protein YjiN (DUF445 family)